MDEAVGADVTAEGDVEPTTRKPAPGGPVDGDRLSEMTYIVQMPASSVRSFPVSQPEMLSCEVHWRQPSTEPDTCSFVVSSPSKSSAT